MKAALRAYGLKCELAAVEGTTVCEHGILDGDWCADCRAEYHEAEKQNIDPEIDSTKNEPPF
jgi:hypothetical protein